MPLLNLLAVTSGVLLQRSLCCTRYKGDVKELCAMVSALGKLTTRWAGKVGRQDIPLRIKSRIIAEELVSRRETQ